MLSKRNNFAFHKDRTQKVENIKLTNSEEVIIIEKRFETEKNLLSKCLPDHDLKVIKKIYSLQLRKTWVTHLQKRNDKKYL